MIHLLFVLIAVISTVAVLIFASRKGVVNVPKLNIYKPCEDGVTPFSGVSLILLTIVCFATMMVVQMSLYRNTLIINFVKLFGVCLLVLAAGVVDAKRKIIPNILILAGLFFRAGLYVYEFFCAKEMLKAVVINDLIGFGVGFVFLAVVSLISKGAIGFGDAKLFGIIGICTGPFCTYSTLLLSLLLSAVISVVQIFRKKMGRKDTIPFGPCIAAGYVVALLLSSY